MTTCVFITGTNCSGKSTIARALIERFGGIKKIENNVTYTVDGGLCLAGSYRSERYGGVDALKADDGKKSGTKKLADAVSEGLKYADAIVCEGSYMNTFGINLTNALFLADRHLVVNIYAPPTVIYSRLTKRSNGQNNSGTRNYERIFYKQRQAMVAARKFKQIGVKVLQYDTSVTDAGKIAQDIIDFIQC